MRASPHSCETGILIRIGGEKDEASCGVPGENFTGCFNPGTIWESNIHQDNIWFEPLDRPHCSSFGCCLADDSNAVVIVQDGSQTDSDHFMVVD